MKTTLAVRLFPQLRSLLACLCVLIATFAAQAQNYSDIWWNPNESGWGLTIADHQSQLFAVWFTYRQDGRPTWYVIPGGTFSNNRQRFQGDIYTTTGPSYAAASFDPARVTATRVGTATIDFAPSGTGAFTYTLEGVTQTKQIQRQPFGNAAPAWGSDVTDIWWNPAESGWGLTMAQHGDNVFAVWFTYDTDSQPLWVVMPGVTFSGTSAFTGTLYTTTGPYFAITPFDSTKVVVTQAGTATVALQQGSTNAQCAGTQAPTFQPTFRGTSRPMTTCQQPFGDAPPGRGAGPGGPAFPRAPGLLEGKALFLAPPDPVNVTVTTDASRAMTQVISDRGGSVSLTDAKGNRYTLAFPAGAVTDDTAITMTPIATLTGVSYASGVVAGLRLTPEGLVLQKSAVLTIVPAGAFPVRDQTPVGATGGGRDLHYAAPGPDYSRIQLEVPHFSLWGWLLMTPAERTNQMRMKLAAENEARLEHWRAAFLGGYRQRELLGAAIESEPPPSIDQLQAWLDAYYDLVFLPRLQAASGSCENAVAAIDSFNKMTSMLSGLGADFEARSGSFLANFSANLELIRQAFASLKSSCRLWQTAEFKFSPITATIKAAWNIAEKSGNVYKYKPTEGSISLTIPDKPHCSVTDPVRDIDPNGGYLFVDWDARTYRGMAMQNLPISVTCTNGEVPFVPPFPVVYLGFNSEVTGKININGGIDETTAPPGGGSRSVTWRFDRCGQYSQVYCGLPLPPNTQ